MTRGRNTDEVPGRRRSDRRLAAPQFGIRGRGGPDRYPHGHLLLTHDPKLDVTLRGLRLCELGLSASLSFSLTRGRSAGFMIGCHACDRRLAVQPEHNWPAEGRLGKRVGLTALAGSNPASSARWKQALTCGNAVRIKSAQNGVAFDIEAASRSSGLNFRPPVCGNPAFRRPGAFADIRRHTPRLTNPLQKRVGFTPSRVRIPHPPPPRQHKKAPSGLRWPNA
jgi:hypothetical protein